MGTKKKTPDICVDDWQVQEDLRTLARAREIKADPKRVAAVKKLAQQQMVAAAAAVADSESDD